MHTDNPQALPRMGYGAANIGNLHRELTDEQAWGILDAAWDGGLRYYDTAPHYGLGLSERRLGSFLRTKPRDEYVLSTKVGRILRPRTNRDGALDLANGFHVAADLERVWDFSADGIARSLEDSTERLGLDHVDILYLHDPEQHDLELAVREALPALRDLRDAGIVSAVGVGSMSTPALAAAAAAGEMDLSMVAGRYTLLDRDADSMLPAAAASEMGLVAASIYNSGLLASASPRRDGRFEYGSALPEALWRRLERIVAVCADFDVALPAAAVQFPLQSPIVRSVVIGGSSASQVLQSIEMAQVAIPAELWDALAAVEVTP